MNSVDLSIIRDKLYNLSGRMYDCVINGVDASYELDAIVDELDEWIEFLSKNENDSTSSQN